MQQKSNASVMLRCLLSYKDVLLLLYRFDRAEQSVDFRAVFIKFVRTYLHIICLAFFEIFDSCADAAAFRNSLGSVGFKALRSRVAHLVAVCILLFPCDLDAVLLAGDLADDCLFAHRYGAGRADTAGIVAYSDHCAAFLERCNFSVFDDLDNTAVRAGPSDCDLKNKLDELHPLYPS